MKTYLAQILFLSLAVSCGQGQNALNSTGTISVDDATWSTTPASSTFIYRTNSNFGSISIGSIELSTGAIVEHEEFSTGHGSAPADAVASAGKNFLYVALSGSSEIAQYAIEQSTGLVTFVTSIPTYPGPSKMILHPNGNFLYTLHLNNSQISIHSINVMTGALNFVSGVSVSGPGANSIAINSSGTVLVANSDNYIRSYIVDAFTGTLSYSNYQSPQRYGALAALGSRFYALNYYNNQIWGYDINTGTGQISASSTSNGNEIFPYRAIDFDSLGNFAFTVNGFKGTLESYAINSATGYLSYSNKVDLSSGCTPAALRTLKTSLLVFTACSDGSGRTFSYKYTNGGLIENGSGNTSTISGAVVSSLLILEL